MFQAPAAPQPMGEAAPPAARPASGAPPPAPPQAAPGEFTRLSRRPRHLSLWVRPLHQRQDPHRALRRRHHQCKPRLASSRGCSRRPRRLNLSVRPPAGTRTCIGRSAAGAPAQAGAGEFTRFFQSPLSQAPAAEPGPVFPSAAAPPKPPPPVSSAPGEFTRIFGRGDLPAAQAGPPAGGSATQSFDVRPEFIPPAMPAPSAGPANIRGCFRLSRSRNRSHRRRPRPRLRHQRPRPPRPRKCPGYAGADRGGGGAVAVSPSWPSL